MGKGEVILIIETGFLSIFRIFSRYWTQFALHHLINFGELTKWYKGGNLEETTPQHPFSWQSLSRGKAHQ